MTTPKPCIACLIQPRFADDSSTHFCKPCQDAWVSSPEPSTNLGLAEFALKRREEVLKPSPWVQPT